MNAVRDSVLLLGESGVGKTHYGAQLLKRLMKGDCQLRMDGAATNLEPFESALECLNEGKAADHTPTSTYVDSVWPVCDSSGRTAELVWPDYGGEQIRSMTTDRRVPTAWMERVRSAPAWLLLLRLQQTRVSDDIFSRPLVRLGDATAENQAVQISDQARLIELIQMLMYARGLGAANPADLPRLSVLLSCWDELRFDGTPAAALESRLPLFWAFIKSNWGSLSVMGLSALERPLSPTERDDDYVSQGPEHFGFVVNADGSQSADLTVPIGLLLDGIQADKLDRGQ